MFRTDSFKAVSSYIGKEKLYGLEIPTEYGGIGGSPRLHARLITFLASLDRTGSWIHRVMVPNSLGPSQLLLKYGTDEQKKKYLPKIASGELIPCFGLTGPWNGSDAGSFDDSATISPDGQTLNITCEKRWITLSPEAHLLGLALRVDGKITLVMIDRTTLSPNEQKKISVRSHSPIGSQFPNGHIRIHNLNVPLNSSIIGGSDKIGHGWVMLMECLSHGRGISLPSVSDGGSRHLLWHTLMYTLTRQQFGQPLLNIPAVQSMVADMTLRAFLGHVLIEFYHSCLEDNNEDSSALSAVMKWVMTTWHREIVLNGMDIFAGKGITQGLKNPIAHYYLSNPIPITVEGSNTLTQHVIIPIQTLFEHHPVFRNILHGLESNDPKAFYTSILDMIHTVTRHTFFSVFGSHTQRRLSQTALFGSLSLLYGQHLRHRQDLSGRLGRYISGSVVLSALEWYEHRDIQHHTGVFPKKRRDMYKHMYAFVDRYFFHTHGSRSMMYHHPLRDVHETAVFFLDPKHLSTILEKDLSLDHYHPTTRPYVKIRDLWCQSGDTDDLKTFSSSIPKDLQREIIDVDSYEIHHQTTTTTP